VGVTDEGYLTEGEKNDVTDQESGYDHVQDSDIVGKALAVGGSVVTVPGVGKAHGFVEDNLGIVAVVAVLLALLPLVVGSGTEDPLSKDVVRVGEVVGPLLAVSSVLLLAAVVVSTDAHSIDYVATEHAAEGSRALTVGEPATRTVFLRGSNPWFLHRFVSVEGAELQAASINRTSVLVTVDVPPPESTGVHTKKVRVHGYPATLPRSVLGRLHGTSPLAAAVGSVAVVLSSTYAVARTVLDRNRPVRAVERRTLDRLLRGEE
jgi:signal peptidase